MEKLEWPRNFLGGSLEEKEIAAYLNRILKSFMPYCSNLKHFLSEAEIHPVDRWWEMYLGNVMLNNGFRLDKASQKGPDLMILLENQKKLWIEAVSVEGGDSIPTQAIPTGAVPDEPYLLRLTSGICYKNQKINGYLKKGIIGPDDFVVIAINVGKFSFWGGDGPFHPAISKVAFGIGKFAFRWSVENGKPKVSPRGFHQERPTVIKKPEITVSTNIFSQPEYDSVSALMFSRTNPLYMPEKGEDITTAYNPLAKNKMSEDFFGFGKRCFVGENQVRYQKNENGLWVDDKNRI